MDKPEKLTPPDLIDAAYDFLLTYDAVKNNYDDAIRSLFPYGNGAPVMVVPGFMAHDIITGSLGNFVSSLGYAGKKWKGGLHLGVSDYKLQHFEERLNYVFNKHGQRPITLIGWSLGGIVSREMARMQPDKVAQVITLGSPFKAPEHPESTHLKAAFDFATQLDQKLGASKEIMSDIPALLKHQLSLKTSLRDKMKMGVRFPLHCVERLFKQPKVLSDNTFNAESVKPIDVPSTHIYTQNDGVVHWKTCIGEENERTQNIEVNTSHIGLPFDAAVRLIIADRLYHNAAAQKQDWQKFDASPYQGLFGLT
ncbi:MAG: alpha/beta fold hydrolase [Pseudomonadota bacterium]|jgi:pimeloyl-ACP methyl ester carboxylesterase|nr:alpha/beta fold hydrolase [Pseudomonadota bacterium]MED5423613.1 alpha/beta fold hydrolase [Pseudomonadota bacterium]